MLIDCAECGKRVSDTAESCIHCGATKSAMEGSRIELHICQECGANNGPTAHRCESCGAPAHFLRSEIDRDGVSASPGSKVAPANDRQSAQTISDQVGAADPAPHSMVYAASFLGAQFFSGLASKLIVASTLSIVISPQSSLEDDTSWVATAIFVSALVSAAIFIGIYSITKGRLVRKAFPWIVGLGALGIVVSFLLPNESSLSGFVINAASTAGFILFLITFASYFKRQTGFQVPIKDRDQDPRVDMTAESQIVVAAGFVLMALLVTTSGALGE